MTWARACSSRNATTEPTARRCPSQGVAATTLSGSPPKLISGVGVIDRKGDQGDPEGLDQRQRLPAVGGEHPPGDGVEDVHQSPERHQDRDDPRRRPETGQEHSRTGLPDHERPPGWRPRAAGSAASFGSCHGRLVESPSQSGTRCAQSAKCSE